MIARPGRRPASATGLRLVLCVSAALATAACGGSTTTAGTMRMSFRAG